MRLLRSSPRVAQPLIATVTRLRTSPRVVCCAFPAQDDMCLWNLTVRETVTFGAKLRLPQAMPESEKEDRITELLSLLGLSHVADNIVGKEGRRGISGGERKRVSVGVELITSPDVIFLDEPTSGLGAIKKYRKLRHRRK